MASGCGTSGDTAEAAKIQNGVGSSDVEPSSSEQSADTVIYVGPSEETDGEHPPVYIPSLSAVENRCHPLNKLLLREPGGQSKSTPSSPQRSVHVAAASSKTSAAAAAAATKAASRPNGASSARSSPVRNPKTSAAGVRKERPEERWIDGPRMSKTRAQNARAMLMGKKDDGKTAAAASAAAAASETWIDGPMHAGGQHANVYGFMDYHKKNMIKKWVEHQVYQVTDKQNHHRHREAKDYGALKTDELGPRGRASGQEENGDDESKREPAMVPVMTAACRSIVENSQQVGRGIYYLIFPRLARFF